MNTQRMSGKLSLKVQTDSENVLSVILTLQAVEEASNKAISVAECTCVVCSNKHTSKLILFTAFSMSGKLLNS